MNAHPYQPLVPGLDGPLDGLLVSIVAGKARVGQGIIGFPTPSGSNVLVEQTAAQAVNAGSDVGPVNAAAGNLADGTYLLYANHPEAKEADGVTTMPRFTIGRKEEYVPKVNIINNTAGQLVGRSRVIASVTVASAAVTAVSCKARYELNNFEGHFTEKMPGGFAVTNNNLDK